MTSFNLLLTAVLFIWSLVNWIWLYSCCSSRNWACLASAINLCCCSNNSSSVNPLASNRFDPFRRFAAVALHSFRTSLEICVRLYVLYISWKCYMWRNTYWHSEIISGNPNCSKAANTCSGAIVFFEAWLQVSDEVVATVWINWVQQLTTSSRASLLTLNHSMSFLNEPLGFYWSSTTFYGFMDVSCWGL